MSCGTGNDANINGASQATGGPTAVGSLVTVTIYKCGNCGWFLPKGQTICRNPKCKPGRVKPGAEEYDPGRMMGRQYRKAVNEDTGLPFKGAAYEAAGRKYVVGAKSENPQDWSCARANGLAPAPKGGGVVVGRYFEQAAALLSQGKAILTDDGAVEVYDDKGLVAVYDPALHATADVYGHERGSVGQFAALMAYEAYRSCGVKAPPFRAGDETPPNEITLIFSVPALSSSCVIQSCAI
jgi:hypothetical protein